MNKLPTCIIAAILVVSLVLPVAGAQAPDYGKIVQLHLSYAQGKYTLTSAEVKYGTAPNLNILSGPLRGTILDAKGNELKLFSLPEPGVAFGDIATSAGEIAGYTEQAGSGDMAITLPYLPDMHTFSLTDSRDGALLATVDLSPPVATFCADYPLDPDCAARFPASPQAPGEPATTLLPAFLLAAAALLATGAGIWAFRRRNVKETALVIDDDPSIATLIATLLGKRGYTTLTAQSGTEALDVLKRRTVDMILLDVLMKPMDGWQTLEAIKKNPDSRSIPVLLITGKKLTAAEAKQYNLHIDDYITKPFHAADLYEAVDQIRVRKQKLNDTLKYAKEAGVDEEICQECMMLKGRISANRKILDILDVPRGVPKQTDLDTLDDMLVVDYINVRTSMIEKRMTLLQDTIGRAFKSRGLPEPKW